MLCAGANFCLLTTFFRRKWRKRRLSGGQWRTTCFHGFHKSFNEKAFYRTQVRSLPCLVGHSVGPLVEFCSNCWIVITRWISFLGDFGGSHISRIPGSKMAGFPHFQPAGEWAVGQSVGSSVRWSVGRSVERQAVGPAAGRSLRSGGRSGGPAGGVFID